MLKSGSGSLPYDPATLYAYIIPWTLSPSYGITVDFSRFPSLSSSPLKSFTDEIKLKVFRINLRTQHDTIHKVQRAQ